MTRVKICGITREEDALAAAAAGADFLGFIFVPESPRHVDAAVARRIGDAVRAAGHTTRLVGVFRNETREEVRRLADEAGVDLVQLHGDEDDELVRSIGRPVIKALHVGETQPETASHPSADWLLFDTLHDRLAGGTGKRFDWSLLTGYDRAKPFFLSGGVTIENVVVAITFLRPEGVDLASGVESAPGIKDHGKIAEFFERVRGA